MNTTSVELADIVRTYGEAYLAGYGSTTSWHQRRVLLDITRCRMTRIAIGAYRGGVRRALVCAALAGVMVLATVGMMGCYPSLSGCSPTEDKSTPPAAKQPAQPPASVEATPPEEMKYSAGAWELGYPKIRYETQTHGMAAGAGCEVLTISFYANHSSDQPLSLHNEDFNLTGASGASYELMAPETQGFNAESPPIEPQYSYMMRLGYSVPETETAFSLRQREQRSGRQGLAVWGSTSAPSCDLRARSPPGAAASRGVRRAAGVKGAPCGSRPGPEKRTLGVGEHRVTRPGRDAG